MELPFFKHFFKFQSAADSAMPNAPWLTCKPQDPVASIFGPCGFLLQQSCCFHVKEFPVNIWSMYSNLNYLINMVYKIKNIKVTFEIRFSVTMTNKRGSNVVSFNKFCFSVKRYNINIMLLFTWYWIKRFIKTCNKMWRIFDWSCYFSRLNHDWQHILTFFVAVALVKLSDCLHSLNISWGNSSISIAEICVITDFVAKAISAFEAADDEKFMSLIIVAMPVNWPVVATAWGSLLATALDLPTTNWCSYSHGFKFEIAIITYFTRKMVAFSSSNPFT